MGNPYQRAIDEYNRKVRQYNQQVQRGINEYNRQVRQFNDQQKRNVDKYNQEVRRVNQENQRRVNNYNNEVRRFNASQRQNLTRAMQVFNRTTLITSSHYSVSRTNVQILENRFSMLEDYNQRNIIDDETLLVDYPTQETNNSVQLYNALTGKDAGDYIEPATLQISPVEERLFHVSSELGKRWGGALFSLNPQNPDASRHFCTSVREIFIKLLDIKAPDNLVLLRNPACELYQGRPTRREKIGYLLDSRAIINQPMIDFVDADIDDLLDFFRTLNDGTHGSAGTFSVQQLLKIKKRAEDSILFITDL